MKNTQAKILFRSSLLAALCIIQHIYGHDPGSLVIQGDIQTGYVNPEKVEFKKVSVDLKCQVMSSPGALVVLAGGQKFTDIHIAQNRVSFALSTKSFNKHNMPKPLASDFLKSFKGNYSRDVGITALSLKCEKFRGGFAAGTRDKAIALIYTDGPLKLKGEWTTPRNKVYIVDANFEGKGFHALELSRENEKWYLRPLPRKKSPSITVQIILDM